MIYDIILVILGLLIAFGYVHLFITERKHSNKIQDVRDYYHDLRDECWDTEHDVECAKQAISHMRNSIYELSNNLKELHEALNMQGIATTFDTKEVKTLVKPEKREGE